MSRTTTLKRETGSTKGHRGAFALVAVLGAILFVSVMLAIIIGSLKSQLSELTQRTQSVQQDHLMRAAAERAWWRSSVDVANHQGVWTPTPNAGYALHTEVDDRVVEVRLRRVNATEFIREQRFRIEEGHASPL